MKHTLLIILFLGASIIALNGQSKWTINADLSVGFSGEQKNKNDVFDDPNSFFSSNRKSRVQPSLGAGISVERHLGKRWGIISGLQYSYLQSYDYTEDQSQSRPSVFSSNYYSSTKQKISAHQLQTPLEVSFYFGKKNKLRPFINAGGLASYTLKAQSYTEYLWSSNGFTNQGVNQFRFDIGEDWSQIKRWGLTSLFGFGLDFGHFSVEINRAQSILRQSNYYDYYYIDTNSYLPTRIKKVHQTTMTIKYCLNLPARQLDW